MSQNSNKQFDLNIEKILEGWESCHAIRELIANALDEQTLSDTREPEIFKDRRGWWHIRDFGRGLRYQHLTQNESKEKLRNAEKVVGKFGVGLKDALATLNRRGVKGRISSRHGDISLQMAPKHGFGDVHTLHAIVDNPKNCRGTDVLCATPRLLPTASRDTGWTSAARSMSCWQKIKTRPASKARNGLPVLVEESRRLFREYHLLGCAQNTILRIDSFRQVVHLRGGDAAG